MYKNILKFSAIAKNMSFSRGWKDAHGNVILVAEVGGKKHAFYRGPDSQDWYYLQCLNKLDYLCNTLNNTMLYETKNSMNLVDYH